MATLRGGNLFSGTFYSSSRSPNTKVSHRGSLSDLGKARWQKEGFGGLSKTRWENNGTLSNMKIKKFESPQATEAYSRGLGAVGTNMNPTLGLLLMGGAALALFWLTRK